MTFPLFDTNGFFGPMAAMRSDFPRAIDLLAHMDRLGVGRALAWHVTARDQHSPTGNRLLLREIGDCPGASGRLIPVMGISVGMLYEKQGLRSLEETLKQRKARALKIFPSLQRLELLGFFRVRIQKFDVTSSSLQMPPSLPGVLLRIPATRFRGGVQHGAFATSGSIAGRGLSRRHG